MNHLRLTTRHSGQASLMRLPTETCCKSHHRNSAFLAGIHPQPNRWMFSPAKRLLNLLTEQAGRDSVYRIEVLLAALQLCLLGATALEVETCWALALSVSVE